jgi:hypothetical protein
MRVTIRLRRCPSAVPHPLARLLGSAQECQEKSFVSIRNERIRASFQSFGVEAIWSKTNLGTLQGFHLDRERKDGGGPI